jgi:hypothetical protein
MSRLRFAPIALGLAVAASPAKAQQVSAGIGVIDGPLTAHILIGQPYYPRPVAVVPRRWVVVGPYAPRLIVVERVHRGVGFWRHHGFNRVSAYYDRDNDRYYDRYDRRYAGLREVELYERDGRYYRDDRDGDRGRCLESERNDDD